MGAESSNLKNCQLQEALEVSGEQEWELHHGKTGDGSPVSVFVYKKAVQNKDLIENAAKVRPYISSLHEWTSDHLKFYSFGSSAKRKCASVKLTQIT